MEGRQAARTRIYEDFQPSSDFVEGDVSDILIVALSDFTEEQIWIEVDVFGNLEISGECAVGNNKWRRFHKEFAIPANCNINDIQAHLQNGNLFIRMPKIITDQQDEGKPTLEAPKIQEHVSEPKSLTSEDRTPQKASSTSNPKEQTDGKSTGFTNAEVTPEQKEHSDTKGKSIESKDTKNFAEKTTEKLKKKKDEYTDSEIHGKLKNYMHANVGNVKELQKPQLVVNMVVAIIVVLVVAVYVTY
ncbi:hypothetical protein HHK36_011546 [Tetracentron sinense]|uniref:SHSP domain-containing protein n=1 Tax=Tetracentron sinense TaxID=13715 RepID=A0A835DJZ3_TETSI|nr:hypothetical protein HHK36_011546 [Tetracentron sinense]